MVLRYRYLYRQHAGSLAWPLAWQCCLPMQVQLGIPAAHASLCRHRPLSSSVEQVLWLCQPRGPALTTANAWRKCIATSAQASSAHAATSSSLAPLLARWVA